MRINRAFLAFCRTIHIYLSMLGLFVMLGFAITGFTAHHEEWFHATEPRVDISKGQTPQSFIDKNDALHIVEHNRQAFGIGGAMASYDDRDDPIAIVFKSPGIAWEISIDKSTGATTLTRRACNAVAVINDLHRGRDAGDRWGWVIDISAGLIVLACFTGVVLWLVLPKRRKIGLAAAFLGTIATLAVFYLMVPGKSVVPESRSAGPTTAPSDGPTFADPPTTNP